MIDWSKPLEYENGTPVFLVGELSSSGSCLRMPGPAQEYAEMYAEMYEGGVRYLVSISEFSHRGYCVDEHGCPRESFDDGWHAAPMRVRNRDMTLDTGAMPDSALWGMF